MTIKWLKRTDKMQKRAFILRGPNVKRNAIPLALINNRRFLKDKKR
jgi:hypothetical protein